MQECRGLILEEGTWAVACWPFAKFFNAEEPNAAAVLRSFAFDGAKIFEKCDGSLATLYHFGGGWHVASISLLAADGQVQGAKFSDLFWETWERLGYALPSNRRLCYMFELPLPHANRRVIRHQSASSQPPTGD